MSAQTVSFSLSKPFDIYTDKYITSVPYLNMVHTLLSGVGDTINVDSNGFLGNTFRTMQFIVDNTNIELSREQLAVIYNKTIRLKGQVESVYYFFIALGITVTITYNSDDATVMFAIIDFGDVRIKDLVAFEQGYTQLINELLFFGQGDFMYDHIEVYYDFNKTVLTEVGANYTNMITISPPRINIKATRGFVSLLISSSRPNEVIKVLEDYLERITNTSQFSLDLFTQKMRNVFPNATVALIDVPTFTIQVTTK